MKRFESRSLEETEKFAETWLKEISQNRTSVKGEATLVGLSGHLGAGKTAFTKVIGKMLGVQEEITSPTFVIMKMYPIDHLPWKRLVHIDAYRLDKPQEIEVLNFEKLVSDPDNLIFIEWPGNVGLTQERLTYSLQFESQNGIYSIENK